LGLELSRRDALSLERKFFAKRERNANNPESDEKIGARGNLGPCGSEVVVEVVLVTWKMPLFWEKTLEISRAFMELLRVLSAN
jgi:hypothetical protein